LRARYSASNGDQSHLGSPPGLIVNWLVDQLIQLAGSALILIAFAGAQTGRLNQKSRRYLLANALGSAVLAVEAAYYRQWGFLLLEGAWAIISVLGMVSAVLPAGKDPDWSSSADGPVPKVQRGSEAGGRHAVVG